MNKLITIEINSVEVSLNFINSNPYLKEKIFDLVVSIGKACTEKDYIAIRCTDRQSMIDLASITINKGEA